MQMAHSALNAVVAFLCCEPGPGMHELSRQCCAALCQAGVAQPLVGLLTSGPDGHRCTEVYCYRLNMHVPLHCKPANLSHCGKTVPAGLACTSSAANAAPPCAKLALLSHWSAW